jgi:hypothetical protein
LSVSVVDAGCFNSTDSKDAVWDHADATQRIRRTGSHLAI